MDVDVGKIDGIKIWHDNSKPDSDWFIELIAIIKKHSTCYTIANIDAQRIKQIANVLYRRVSTQPSRPSPSEGKDHLSVGRGSLKSKHSNSTESNERLGSSRSILRSPTLQDKANPHKKVTWDEHSLNSQDDSLSIESDRRTARPAISDEKYQLHWISSHGYRENQWNIRSIDEKHSFDFDQSTRALLLSDRSPVKPSDRGNDDETYQFDAQRWLAKEKDDAKLEVFLTPTKSKSPMPSDSTTRAPDNRPLPQSKSSDLSGTSSQQLKPVGRSTKELGSPVATPRPPPPPLVKSPIKPLEDPATIKSRMALLPPSVPSDPRLKSPRELSSLSPSMTGRSSPRGELRQSAPFTHVSSGSLTSEQELLARISGQSSHHPRLSALPPSASNQSLKSTLNGTNRTTASFSSQSSISQSRVSRSHLHSVTGERELSSSTSREALKNPSATASMNSVLRVPHRNNDLNDPLTRKLISRPSAQSSQMLPPPKSIHGMLRLFHCF